jgi:hypothetical protein
MTAGRAVRYSETNASPTQWAHVFRIRLRPSVARLDRGQLVDLSLEAAKQLAIEG